MSEALPRPEMTRSLWWWGIDRFTLFVLIALLLAGYVLVLAASPGVAERIGAGSRDLFVLRQVVWLVLAFGALLGVSLLSVRQVKWLAVLGLVAALAATAATLVIGVEIKGARRWLAAAPAPSAPRPACLRQAPQRRPAACHGVMGVDYSGSCDRFPCWLDHGRRMQRKPIWLMPVSTIWAWRAAGR